MNIKSIFITLITIVALVVIGAFVLNVLLPNVTSSLVDAVEDMIYKATKLTFDFNHNSNAGANSTTYTTYSNSNSQVNGGGVGVDGF